MRDGCSPGPEPCNSYPLRRYTYTSGAYPDMTTWCGA